MMPEILHDCYRQAVSEAASGGSPALTEKRDRSQLTPFQASDPDKIKIIISALKYTTEPPPKPLLTSLKHPLTTEHHKICLLKLPPKPAPLSPLVGRARKGTDPAEGTPTIAERTNLRARGEYQGKWGAE